MNELLYIDEKFPSYQIIEMLSENPTSRVFLAEREDKLYIIKEQPKEFCFLKNPAILRELDCPGLPKIIDFYETDGSFFYSYEYIMGVTLTEAYESGFITTGAAVAITEKLCGIVSYLHSKSILHCDIKPNNILINGDDVFLIDFGIAHIYDKNSSDDTAIIGTEGFVTPELGYKKTDFRADVYALGMVLYYLLTGSADIKELPEKVSDKQLRAIINRAANYEVGKRYKTVAGLQNALAEYKKGTAIRPVFAGLLSACFVICFVAGGLIFPAVSGNNNDDDAAELPQVNEFSSPAVSDNINTDNVPAVSDNINTGNAAEMPTEFVFSDPITEEAIRLSLGKSADEPVYPDDLINVERLYIVGNRAFASWEDQDAYLRTFFDAGEMPPYGKFESYSDIAACENLKYLNLQYNVLESIDFLKSNRFLEELRLTNANVTDIAVLRDLPQLVRLTIDDCPIDDLSPLKDCPNIEVLTLFHINTVNYDIFTPDKQYNDVSFGFVDHKKFMPYLSGITINRLAVRDCGITSINDFTDVTVTEQLDVRDNNLTDTEGSERILAEGAEIIFE
jgi:serine/threonine protein kinase